MSSVWWGLLSQLVLAVGAVVAAAVCPARIRSVAAGSVCGLLGLAGAATGVLLLTGHTGSAAVDTGVVTLTLEPDRLAGVFMTLVGAVGALCAWFGAGYAHGPAASRTAWTAYAGFLGGMLLVTAAGDVVVFLTGWELMALASTVLVATDHASRPSVRPAVAWYAVLTHAGFLAVLAGLAMLAAAAGGTGFASIAAAALPDPVRDAAFVTLAFGFGMKAGLVPLHVWLPRAHPEAPSHVSAAMSAAMVKLGVYGILLTVLRLLPGGPRWWFVALLAVGLLSSLYGVLQASVASHLKRLLAYSTTENIGLVVVAVGVSGVAAGAGRPDAAGAALLAALLLAVAHAAFKTVLFLSAGALGQATGESDLDRMGGLARTMPVTAAALAVGCLGAAALPVTGGFVAEWTLLQALVHGAGAEDRMAAALMPLTVAVVALVAGLALVTFVKVVGIAVLSRPRSPGSAGAHEVGRGMRGALVAGATLVVLTGLVPGVLVAPMAAAVGADGIDASPLGGVSLTAVGAALNPAALVLAGLAVLVPVVAVTTLRARRQPRRVTALPWGCGGVRVDPRMQYTATSFAEPVTRVFDDALQPSRDLTVTPSQESAYLVRAVQYRQVVADRFEQVLYRPALGALDALGDLGRRVHNGSIGRYLSFVFTALLLALAAVGR
jgi:formate hydrogenlyase subunit 3/multisubunit Na+/H+ antiporter MnhD subunit